MPQTTRTETTRRRSPGRAVAIFLAGVLVGAAAVAIGVRGDDSGHDETGSSGTTDTPTGGRLSTSLGSTTTTTRAPRVARWVTVADEEGDLPRFGPVPDLVAAETTPSDRGAVGFTVSCDYSHSLPDDAIVKPDQPGTSHLHDFFGATTVDAFTTTTSLIRSDTTCKAAADRSVYWFPAAYQDGEHLEPIATSFYYHAPRVANFETDTQPMPLGLRMVAGDAKATGPQSTDFGWFEEHRNAAANHTTGFGDAEMITADDTGKVLVKIRFPECWDGEHLDSPDHKSHMAYPTDNECPPTHPVALPKLEAFVTYQTEGGSGFELASGPWFTLHGDFWNAWEPRTMRRLVDDCIKRSLHCDQVVDV